ncbi:hypothetical protein D3C73_721870 [compost metagenome]
MYDQAEGDQEQCLGERRYGKANGVLVFALAVHKRQQVAEFFHLREPSALFHVYVTSLRSADSVNFW